MTTRDLRDQPARLRRGPWRLNEQSDSAFHRCDCDARFFRPGGGRDVPRRRPGHPAGLTAETSGPAETHYLQAPLDYESGQDPRRCLLNGASTAELFQLTSSFSSKRQAPDGCRGTSIKPSASTSTVGVSSSEIDWRIWKCDRGFEILACSATRHAEMDFRRHDDMAPRMRDTNQSPAISCFRWRS